VVKLPVVSYLKRLGTAIIRGYLGQLRNYESYLSINIADVLEYRDCEILLTRIQEPCKLASKLVDAQHEAKMNRLALAKPCCTNDSYPTLSLAILYG
jgi:hypothetical protein